MAPQKKQFAAADFASAQEAIVSLYREKARPAEAGSFFERFDSPPLEDCEFTSPPTVLLIGQYSTGKTSFIRHLIGDRDFPGMHIGPEPTTDAFTAITKGETDRCVPGSAATSDKKLSFQGLTRFGSTFLDKFSVAEVSGNSILDHVVLVDTPGILSGSKQKARGYDFATVISWFAERASLVLLLFDAYKLDIADEFKEIILSLRPHASKVRCILNKADCIETTDLIRVYGALAWALSGALGSPEVRRTYVSSFWDQPLKNKDLSDWMIDERQQVLADLRKLSAESSTRRLNDLLKRLRRIKMQLMITMYLRKELPTFSKDKAMAAMVKDLDQHFAKISVINNLPLSEFPDTDKWREVFGSGVIDAREFPKTDDLLKQVNAAIDVDVPAILRHFVSSAGTSTEAPLPTPGEHRAWLLKKGPKNSDSYKKRWCVLANGSLEYFKEKGDKTSQGVIPVAGVKVGTYQDDNQSFCFTISGHSLKREFVVAAMNAEEQSTWMLKIRSAAATTGAATTPRGSSLAPAASDKDDAEGSTTPRASASTGAS